MISKALAQIRNPVLPSSIGDGSTAAGGTAIGQMLEKIIGGMFVLGFFIAFIYLITGAFHWITSGGDKANLEHARNKIIHALIGIIVLASTWAIADFTAKFLGLPGIGNIPIPGIK